GCRPHGSDYRRTGRSFHPCTSATANRDFATISAAPIYEISQMECKRRQWGRKNRDWARLKWRWVCGHSSPRCQIFEHDTPCLVFILRQPHYEVGVKKSNEFG